MFIHGNYKEAVHYTFFSFAWIHQQICARIKVLNITQQDKFEAEFDSPKKVFLSPVKAAGYQHYTVHICMSVAPHF